jgi:hypothetical protein
MAITINNVTVIDDSSNANLTQVSISSLGYMIAGAANTTPPHAGTLYGYASAGIYPSRSPPPAYNQTIERFPFATDTNATSVASAQLKRRRGASCSSELAGYAVSGDSTTESSPLPPQMGLAYYFNIEKFNFTTEAPSTGVGNLNFIRGNGGIGVASPTHGYVAGTKIYNEVFVDIERFPFANESESAIVGGMTYYRQGPCEAASLTDGYIINGTFLGAGTPPTVLSNIIEKYRFSSETDAVVVGESTLARWIGVGVSSPTHAYAVGGVSSSPTVRYRTIDKMSFATEGAASYVGDLSSNNASACSSSSATHGYMLGGATSNNPPAPVTATDAIDKFPFATDSNATDIGDLTEPKFQSNGFIN